MCICQSINPAATYSLRPGHGKIAALCRHQRYLELIIEQKDAFDEIGDIIKRHATLATTNEDLRQQQQAAAEETERIR